MRRASPDPLLDPLIYLGLAESVLLSHLPESLSNIHINAITRGLL